MTVSTEFSQVLLTSREAAKALNVSERHLHNLTKQGHIAATRLGGSVRYQCSRGGFQQAM